MPDLHGKLFDRCKLLQMRAGHKRLTVGHDVQQPCLPAGIQLGKHIVEQQHRPFSAQRANQFDLAEFERESNRPLLSLRAVYTYIPPVQQQPEIIPMRTDRRVTSENIPFQPIRQLHLQRFHEPFLIRKRDRRFVSHEQILFSVAHAKMQRICKLRELFDKPGALCYNLASEPRELLIPELDHIVSDRVLFQKQIAAFQRSVVLLQMVVIRRLQLAQFHIQEPSPFRRPILDELQILRREHHNIQAPHQLPGPRCRCFIDPDAFAFALDQFNPDRPCSAACLKIQSDAAERLMLLQQLRIPRGTMAAPERAEED